MSTYFRVTVLSLVGMVFVCFSSVVFSTQDIAVVVGEEILANENSVLSSTVGKSQRIDQQRTRKRVPSNVKVNKNKDVVMVRNGTDPVLLSFVFGENTGKVALNAESTAVSLVLLHPSFLGVRTDIQQALVPEIKSRSSFNGLVDEVRSLVQRDDAPLDYWKHPTLAGKVNEVAKKVLTTVDFETLINASNLRRGIRAPQQVKRGDFMVDEDKFNEGKLIVTNPKAIYYGVYIDEDDHFEKDENISIGLLKAKKGLINVDFKLYPPTLKIVSSEETEFDLERLNSNSLADYQINLVHDFTNWDINTPEGRATWFNLIKGINLTIKTFADMQSNESKEDLNNWLDKNAEKIQKMRSLLSGKTVSILRAGAHAAVVVVGEIYRHCDDPEKKKNWAENYYTAKTLVTFIDQLVDLLKLEPLQSDKLELEINKLVKDVFQLESLSALVKKIQLKGTSFIKTEDIYEKIVLKIQKKLSLAVLSSDIPFSYDYAMKKLAGFFDALETNGILESLLKLVLNDIIAGEAKDSVKAITGIIFKNMFGAYYKVAATGVTIGNEVVPYVYDMFTAPSKVSFSVSGGELKTLPPVNVEKDLLLRIYRGEEKLYDYNPWDNNMDDNVVNRGVEVNQGDCLSAHYQIRMLGNFERGIEAIEEDEIDPDKDKPVSHFSSKLSLSNKQFDFSLQYFFHRLMIWDADWRVNVPDWKYEFFHFHNDNSSDTFANGTNLDSNYTEWPREISFNGHSVESYGFEDDVISVIDPLCLPSDYSPGFIRLKFSNFNEESHGDFYVKLRSPNKPPEIEVYVDRNADDFFAYRFHTYVSDDYTPSEDIQLQISFSEPDGRGDTGGLGIPTHFDHRYSSEGVYKFVIEATDDEGLSSIYEIEVYPGTPFTDLNPSEWYTKPILVLLQNGVIEGFDDGTFRPHQEVTRAEFLKMALLASPFHKDNDFQKTETSFSDVLEEHWASGYIQYATDKEIVTGFTNGEFRPDIGISRVAAAKIIAEVFNLMSFFSHFNTLCPAQFTDVSHLQWYCKYIRELSELNILRGHPDNTFKPTQKMTRAETAATVCRAYSYDQTGDMRLCDEES